MNTVTETTWLYHKQNVKATDFAPFMLDALGEKGWELVAVVPSMYDGKEQSRTYYFKKPVTVTRRFSGT